jgi:hypothetical protein
MGRLSVLEVGHSIRSLRYDRASGKGIGLAVWGLKGFVIFMTPAAVLLNQLPAIFVKKMQLI